MITGYDYLAFHAAERPTGVALIVDGRPITYAQFRRDVAGISRWLRGFGLAPGSLVTVGCQDLYGHWLLLLAFERLGIVTASLSGNEEADCLPVLAGSDLVLAEGEFPIGAAKRSELLSADWLPRAIAGEEDTEPPWAGSDERRARCAWCARLAPRARRSGSYSPGARTIAGPPTGPGAAG